jgi:hypothetical protein
MQVDAEIDAGNVLPGRDEYVVTFTHGHATLNAGDVVVIVALSPGNNILLRKSDTTLHALRAEFDQYVHLKKILSK